MNLVVMAGDDIGPEIIAAAMAVVKAADAEFSLGLRFTDVEVGMASHRKHGTTLTDAALQAAIDADGVIVGPCGMTDYPPLAQGGINIPGTIRKKLDLYANLRPARSRPGMPDARKGLDALIVRENTEGFYSDRTMFMGHGEFMPTEDVALSVRKITRQGGL
jgi:isocitrate/isopropylmalate dehydrogenase